MKCLRKAQGRRLGMTLVELLGVMVVLAILATLAIGGVLNAVERSNVTKCLSAIDGYRSAFLDAAVSHPSMFGDRIQAWGADGSTYSSEQGLKRAAAFMNEVLDDDMHFYWDDVNMYYKTTQVDPWGGCYILTEHPQSATAPDKDYYDCAEDKPGGSNFACSIWATGNNDNLTTPGETPTVADDSYGVCLVFADGVVTPTFNGFNGSAPFEDWTIQYK